jgi:hypothetical protein
VPKPNDHGKNPTGTSPIELIAKSLILRMHDVLMTHRRKPFDLPNHFCLVVGVVAVVFAWVGAITQVTGATAPQALIRGGFRDRVERQQIQGLRGSISHC